MDELRVKIEEITEGGTKTLGEQVKKIDVLKEEFGHSIKHLAYRDADPNLNYTCYMHALGVIGSEVVMNLLKKDAEIGCRYNILIDSDFILRLIEKDILSSNEEGEVIIYFADDKPVHGGRIEDDRVTSKWGVDCLWEHEVWEVPARYGSHTERFSIPNREQVEHEFVEYAQELTAR